MHQNIRLLKPAMIGNAHIPAGVELDMHEGRAAELIRAGHAELTGNLPAPVVRRKVETASQRPAPRRAARLSGRND